MSCRGHVECERGTERPPTLDLLAVHRQRPVGVVRNRDVQCAGEHIADCVATVGCADAERSGATEVGVGHRLATRFMAGGGTGYGQH